MPDRDRRAMTDRLVELETRLAFQDDAVQQLNHVIIRQQQQIDGLLAEIANLKAQLKSLAPSDVVDQAAETPPPHY